MKKVVILLLCVMTLMSCHFHVDGTNLIEPSDNIVTKEYQKSPFKEIVSHVFTTLEIIQSDEKDGLVVLTAPENYIELFKISDKNERLDIAYNKDNINIDGNHVNITIPQCFRRAATALVQRRNKPLAIFHLFQLFLVHLFASILFYSDLCRFLNAS